MKIKLLPGDHEWSLEGTHVCDDLGIAKILDHELEVEVDPSIGERILPIIEYGRISRGLIPDGSLPPPPPEPVVEPVVEPVEPEVEPVVEPVEPEVEPVVEPEVEPEVEPVVEPVEPEVKPVLQASRPRKKKEV
jgi:hypothetical protein